jgi:hypothetical protein
MRKKKTDISDPIPWEKGSTELQEHQPQPFNYKSLEDYVAAMETWLETLPRLSRAMERNMRELVAEDLWVYVYDRLPAKEVKRLYDLRPHRSNYPFKVQGKVKQAAPEVENLWRYVWGAYKRSEKKKDERTPLEIVESAFLKWIKKTTPDYIYPSFFEGKNAKRLFAEDFYPDEGDLKRIFIGKLYQIILSHRFPNLKKTRYYGYKPLYKLHKDLL